MICLPCLYFYKLCLCIEFFFFFFFNDTATTEIYTLSLHDALPIFRERQHMNPTAPSNGTATQDDLVHTAEDRKSTRLNSSHANISYAVFCLKKKPPIESNHLN